MYFVDMRLHSMQVYARHLRRSAETIHSLTNERLGGPVKHGSFVFLRDFHTPLSHRPARLMGGVLISSDERRDVIHPYGYQIL